MVTQKSPMSFAYWTLFAPSPSPRSTSYLTHMSKPVTIEDLVFKMNKIPFRGEMHNFVHDCKKEDIEKATDEFTLQRAVPLLFRVTQLVGPGLLTPAHAALAEILMSRGMFPHARTLFEEKIVEMTPKRTQVNFTDFVTYFTLKGNFHARCQQWEEAFEAYSLVLMGHGLDEVPLGVVAYTNAIVVGALIDVPIPTIADPLPQVLVNAAQRVAYAIQQGDKERALALVAHFESELKRPLDVWRAVVEDLTTQLLLRLTRVYCTLPLTEVAAALSITPATCRLLLSGLVSEGRLLATIDAGDTIVFTDLPVEHAVARLEQGISNCIKVMDSMENLKGFTTSSASYLLSAGHITSELLEGRQHM